MDLQEIWSCFQDTRVGVRQLRDCSEKFLGCTAELPCGVFHHAAPQFHELYDRLPAGDCVLPCGEFRAVIFHTVLIYMSCSPWFLAGQFHPAHSSIKINSSLLGSCGGAGNVV